MIRLMQPHPNARTLYPKPTAPARTRNLALQTVLLGAVLIAGALAPMHGLRAAEPGTGKAPSDPSAAAAVKYAGTYRIDGWQSFQKQGLYHFFYLHPNGSFLLAGEWPKNERSRFVGTWSVADDRLYLHGVGAVDTNQGAWRTEYDRTFRIQVNGEGFVLKPEPAKNRFGLMGWPNAFHYYRGRPVPNLPGVDLPETDAAMADHIAKALARMQ